ncbi:MAG: M81 family metallopeptidase [Labilithrix sp.]|nr:M81 family metallopeptidase [Labilithrix sp.]
MFSAKRPLRIAYGRLFHEANAYSPVATTLEDFERFHLMSGDALERASSLRGVELKSFMPHAELTGFRQAARLAGGVTCVPLESAMAVPGGPLARACFDELCGRLLARLERALPLDGVYLALHGSMQVEGLDEAPEAHLLRRVREVVGASVKIAVSYDLHANLSEGLVAPATILTAYRTNPHWDLAPTGYRAGRRLIRAIRGEITPVHAWRKLPMVMGGGTTIDFLSPMRGVFRWMRKLERDPRVVSASLFMVHPFTDAEQIGWAVHVSTDGDRGLAEELADRLADRAWQTREIAPPPMRDAAAAIDEVRASRWRKLGPVTLVDVDDVVGAGAPGGNTHVVRELLERGRDVRAYVPVHDPALVDALRDAPVGASRDVVLAGTPGYGMPAVKLARARVAAKAEGDFGLVVRLDVDALRIVVAERAPLPIHPSFWSAVGLSARAADLIVQKNFFHYRMFYALTSFQHIPVVTDGATSLTRVRDQEYAVPMAPKARLDDWRPFDARLRAARVRRSREREIALR